MIKLPEKFEQRMRELLCEEAEAFFQSFEDNHTAGLRVNTMKLSPETFLKLSPFELKKIPWIPNGFYFDTDALKPSKHPYYYAGLYYLQEPSAMTPAEVLPIEKGDRVLDLCAAPGGKSTELSAKLNGEGVLVSNDISNSRAKALLKNLEVFGTKNAIILSETPQRLSERFSGYFDKILVDAPCSGEGMFRKSPPIMKNWEQYGVEYYRKLQREILPFAVKMLRPGGQMVFSTCTFSPEEDEGTLMFLLHEYPEMSVIKPSLSYEGFREAHPEWVNGPDEIKNAIRIWPHKMDAEGHFVALLKKAENDKQCFSESEEEYHEKLPEECLSFLKRIKMDFRKERLMLKNDFLYYLPEGIPPLSGLRILRSGLLLGELKKNRFEPSQALACALKAEEFDSCYCLSAGEEDVIRYLKCETITAKSPVKDGYVLILVDGFPLGFGKAANGIIKNKYLPGWRMM